MNPEQFAAIIADVNSGSALHLALEAHGANRKAFYALIAQDDDAREKYARAKRQCCEAWAAETLEIADQDPKLVEIRNDRGEVVEVKIDTAYEQWRKTRIETRKWHLAKLLPRVYGDSMDLRHSGAVAHVLNIHDEQKAIDVTHDALPAAIERDHEDEKQ